MVGMVGVVGEDNSSSLPQWLPILLGEKFFTPCLLHSSNSKRNEKTFFCLRCCSAICFSCFSSHRSHALLQIRRYVYHEVIRLGDAQKLLNCSLVQPYTTNSAKVIFLQHRRGKRRALRGGGSGNLCITCFRTLQCPYLFCSLSCKINHKTEITNKKHNNSDHLPPPSTPEETAATPAAIKLVKKKRSCVKSLATVLCQPRCFPVVSDITTVVNRRKGVPQRSPLL
ncbi:hypothetical protein SDJN03_23872, partial [Cucurbita argyrosperma subsp. sororia]